MKIIPYGRQWVDASDIREVIKVLKSDWLTQGPKIKEFEDALCKYTGAKYAVAVSSGTAALHIACLAAGIKSGDEVITSPITFVASANSILYCGGTPVFADIQKDTVNIDPEEIRKKISPNTKAIIPVHFAGHPCDLEEISLIAQKHNLLVIEDAAHALGAEYKNTKIGSCKYSDMAIFSFHPVKSITTGEGGTILTNNEEIFKKLLIFRNHGIAKEKAELMNKNEGPWFYEMQELGFNYRITDIQATLGISQLKKINSFISDRREIAKFYNKSFKGNNYFDIPVEREYVFSAYHLYPIRVKDKFKVQKKEIFNKMRDSGLGIQVHYIPVYLQPFYKKLGYKIKICPKAEDFYEKEISIPMYPSLKDTQIKFVVKEILKIFKNYE
ncbi:MAG: UDP-4-amino-4,6-dideoxy-N-acetyl-beta-L-altrosamine transaminase [Actinobacteria bacterium]|nr:UDP-4-amino-4,6-dideoxy-N-acetyl-beta-L-altrosamine transaminase [Actinomycetota bacterium]